ncbi:MAG: hypothetical protein QXE31_00465 [Candidatus Woesearchaeota archaeon]
MTLNDVIISVNQETVIEWITEIEERYLSVKRKVNEINLDNWPKPLSREPSYLVNGQKKTLEELTEEDFNPIINFLSGILNLSTFENEEKNIIARSMAILNTVFWNFEKNEAKTRKYESVYSITHLLSVAYMFENPDLETLLVALNHDTIEDSYRHKVLKRYYLGENISDEDAELVGLSEEELKIKDKRLKRGIYNKHLKELIINTLSLIGLEHEKSERVRIYLDALTHRIYESYENYIKRLVRTATRLGVEGYKLVLIKGYDRLDNSHFNPHYNMPEIFEKEGLKILRDAVKDVFVLEAISDYIANEKSLDDKQIEELLKVKVALGSLLNRNMNQLMIYIRENYRNRRLTREGEEKNLEDWFNECEKKLNEYYELGGFNQRDINPSSKNPNEIFKYNGSITSLSLFIEDKGSNLFRSLSYDFDLLKLYKFCAVAKAIGCLNAGYNPFINGRLITNIDENDIYGLNSWGNYDSKLLRFQISCIVI